MILDAFGEDIPDKLFKSYFNKYSNYINRMDVDKRVLNIVYETNPELQALYMYDKYGKFLESEERNELEHLFRMARRKIDRSAIIIYNKKYKE